jgi:hypothetical protein
MVHHLVQTVFKQFLFLVVASATLIGADIPIMKVVTLNIPLKEYSILDFPFKIVDVQTKTFTYKTKVPKNNPKKRKVTLAKRKDANVLGVEKGVNVLTFRPTSIGYTEMIVWGYSEFPMILKINVTDPKDAHKHIRFIEVLDKKQEIQKFESNSHEKIIEEITQHLYDENYSSKPAGYESRVRKDEYIVEVLGDDKEPVAMLSTTLTREIIGRDYVGQVWNVNIKEAKDSILGFDTTPSISDDFEVRLYEEMFDEEGVFSVSLETYTITKAHGTRVMVVRRKD